MSSRVLAWYVKPTAEEQRRKAYNTGNVPTSGGNQPYSNDKVTHRASIQPARPIHITKPGVRTSGPREGHQDRRRHAARVHPITPDQVVERNADIRTPDRPAFDYQQTK
jgi:hypothetical protein